MFARYIGLSGVFLLSLISCSSRPKGPPAIGEAFVGPATLNIRQELAPRAPVVAAVKHGDRPEILQTRRRFVRVRTASGATGWTDTRQLLSTEQMRDLRKLTEDSAKLPSHGAATVFDTLNIHTDPSRTAPSFAQIPANGSVDVLAHTIAPRNPPREPVTPVVAPKPPAPKKKPKESSRIPPPPMPDPPKLPPNWLELSRRAEPAGGDEEAIARETDRQNKEKDDDPAEKPVPMEDWSLVRTKEGKAGWVLTRNLIMAIPDEVAQYAEGHRITSYFALADVKDGDEMKHAWLWTTMSRGVVAPYEFDSFRVFIWSLRRHRYETAYIERRIKGYFPVETRRTDGGQATFSLIFETDGGTVRKTYAFNGVRVNLANKEPYQRPAAPAAGEGEKEAPKTADQPAPAPPSRPWYTRLHDRVRNWFR